MAGKDKEKVKASKLKKALERRDYLNSYKLSKGCAICGFNSHPQALSFDHIDPSLKRSDYSSKNLSRWSLEEVNAEIAKCRVLCANCHMIETYNNKHHTLPKKQPL